MNERNRLHRMAESASMLSAEYAAHFPRDSDRLDRLHEKAWARIRELELELGFRK